MSSKEILFLHKWFLCLASVHRSAHLEKLQRNGVIAHNKCLLRKSFSYTSDSFCPASIMCWASESYPYLTPTSMFRLYNAAEFLFGIVLDNQKRGRDNRWSERRFYLVYISSLYLSDSVKLRVHLLSRWRGRIKIFLATLQLKEREKWLLGGGGGPTGI